MSGLNNFPLLSDETSCHTVNCPVKRPIWKECGFRWIAREEDTLSPTAHKVLNLANNLVSLEVDPFPVKPSAKTPALART